MIMLMALPVMDEPNTIIEDKEDSQDIEQIQIKPHGTRSGESWLENWTYRKLHNITGSDGAGFNYTVRIKTLYSETILDNISSVIVCEDLNPIIPNGSADSWDGRIREIGNIIYNESDAGKEYKTWYTGYNGTYDGYNLTTGYAYSSDGISWTKLECNLTNAEDPFIIENNGTYYIYYEKKGMGNIHEGIALANSTDCQNWTYQGLVLEKGIGWEGTDVSSPTIIIVEDVWYMFYEGRGGGQWGSMGLATSNNGSIFIKNESNPIFEPSDTVWADDSLVCDSILKYEDSYYLFYHAVNVTAKIGMAKSTNLTTWYDNQQNPISPSSLVNWNVYYDTANNRYSGHYTPSDTSGIYKCHITDNHFVSINGKCNQNFSDIKFTDNDGVTELFYWMESKTDSIYADFWVEVLDNLSINQSIYVYYGNILGESGSDIKETSLYNHGDDFNDNIKDSILWDIYEVGTGSVNETNNRIEVTSVANGDQAGYVSNESYLMENLSMSVFASCSDADAVSLYLGLTKINGSSAYSEDDWYRIMLRDYNNKLYIQKRVSGGSVSTLYSAEWSGSSNNLSITINNELISFYEGSDERANDTWALGSKNCYIYLYGNGITGWLGTDWMDTFWIRKRIYPEPTHDIWGSEEQYQAESPPSNETYNITLYAGYWNFKGYTNSTLTNPTYLYNEIPNCTAICGKNMTSGYWYTYWPALGMTEAWNIVYGDGLYILVEINVTWEIGNYTNSTTLYANKYNPVVYAGVTASDASTIYSAITNCTAIMGKNITTGYWYTYWPGIGLIENFDIIFGDGLFILVSKASSWNHV